MPQPPAYNPAYSFTDFSSGSPTSMPPGDKLDGEFNAIGETLQATLANLAKIQRDDCQLANGSVGLDQITNEAILGLSSGSAVDAVKGAIPTTPFEYRAVGNGAANDAPCLQAALDTGKDVYLPAGYTFRHDTALSMTRNNQRLYGPGVLQTNGAIDGVVIGGGCNGAEVSVTVNSPGQTSGWAVKVSNATRVNIQRMNVIDAYGMLYAEKFNTLNTGFIWGTLRGPGIKLYGDNSKASDAAHFERAIVSPGAGFYGFDWDGGVHTVSGRIGVVTGKGVIARNTSGGTRLPAVSRVLFEVDYSTADGIRIDAGEDIDLTDSYVLGATGSGLYVSAAVAARQVRISGGKYEGNGRYGIENLGGAISFAANSRIVANTLGDVVGLLYSEGYRFSVDPNAYWTMIGGNPYEVYDTTAFTAFDRGGLTLIDSIGGNILARDPNRITAYKPIKLASYTVAALPAGQDGDQAMVTDANATTYMSAVAGGGSNKVRVTYLGGWKIA